MNRILQLTLLLTMLSALSATSASAYIVLFDQYGNYRTWQMAAIPWRVAASGSKDISKAQIESALQSAFDSWQNVPCTKLKFQNKGFVSAPPNDGIFIRWQDSMWYSEVADAAGVTMNWKWVNQKSAPVKKVEIYFNGVNFTWVTEGADDPFSDAVDVQAVAAHEIGHAIGLDHPRHRFATMFFSMFPGQSEAQRTLEEDDKRAVCFLYPKTNFKSGQPCDTCANNTNCENGQCLDYGGGEGAYCSRDCSATAKCPPGFGCFKVQGLATPQCIAENNHCAPTGGNISVGDYCYDHSTCKSGKCLVLPDSAVCSMNCTPGGANNGGCPSKMVCLGKDKQGICYPKGNGQLGDSCKSPADCSSFDCIGIGAGQGICTQNCSADTQCPNGFKCSFGYCITPGTKPYGESCQTLLECQSGFCHPFAKYCTTNCKKDTDCPDQSKCTNSGYCSQGPTGVVGDVCGEDAKECKSQYFCFYDQKGKKTGTCQYKCDARFDTGCPSNTYCEWVYQDWLAKIVGVCKGDNGGNGLDTPCGGSIACLPHLVCADTDGNGPKCRQDCNAKNLLGCAGDSTCIGLGLENNPKLGACHPKDAGPAADSPQVVETFVAEPVSRAEETANVAEPPPASTTGQDGSDGANGGTTDGLDGGIGWGTGGTGGSSSNATTKQSGPETSSGGCTHSGHGSLPSSTGLLLLVLVMLSTWSYRKQRV